MRISKLCDHSIELEGEKVQAIGFLKEKGFDVLPEDFLVSTSLYRDLGEGALVVNPWKNVERIRSSLMRSNRKNPFKNCEKIFVVVNREISNKQILVIRIP